jgi:hypothetical protein
VGQDQGEIYRKTMGRYREGQREGACVFAAVKARRGGVVYHLKTFVAVIGILTRSLHSTVN